MRYPDDDVRFDSSASDVVLDFPLVTLPSGAQVTALPLADCSRGPLPNGALLRASLTRVEAIAALAGFGLVLCPLSVLHEMASVGIWIPPVTLVRDAYDQAHMRSLGYKREHDRRAWEHLARLDIHPEDIAGLGRCVFNFGKTHKAAEANGKPVPENGDNFMGGWDKTDNGRPDFIQAGTGRNHLGEAATADDYGTNVVGMVPR